MEKRGENKPNYREILKLISTIISWTVFVLLLICAVFLVYYFIATRIYVQKGSGHEPKFSLYNIVSGSMIPNINVYDVVIDVKIDRPEDIKINDVITFYADIPEIHGNTITHRVIAINKDTQGNYFFRTKGDNNLVEDGIDIPFDNIVGKVALRIPGLGNVQGLLASKSGLLILILIPALFIVIKALIRGLKNTDNIFKKAQKLIPYRKRKLLTYTPTPNLEEVKPEEQKPIETSPPTYFFDDDDDDDFDLPGLK